MIVLGEDEKRLMSLHLDFWNKKLKKPIISNFSLSQRLNYLINSNEVLHKDWLNMDESAVLNPYRLSPERHQNYYEYNDFDESRICGLVFNTIIPWTMVTWLPGIAGCDLKISKEGMTIWPVHYLGDGWFKEKNSGLKPRKEWLDKLLEFTSYLVDNYYPKRMVSLELFSRGPGDLLINVLGAESAYISMYDHPNELKKLLSRLADIHINWAREQLKIIPKINNGYCNQWGIWAPGSITRIQEDYAINLSERHFKDFLAPADNKIIEAFDYQVFHTHSGDPNLATWLLGLEELKAIEVTLDPIAPPLENLIPAWNRILDKKPLIISGNLTQKEVEMLISKLDPSGLFLDINLLPG